MMHVSANRKRRNLAVSPFSVPVPDNPRSTDEGYRAEILPLPLPDGSDDRVEYVFPVLVCRNPQIDVAAASAPMVGIRQFVHEVF